LSYKLLKASLGDRESIGARSGSVENVDSGRSRRRALGSFGVMIGKHHSGFGDDGTLAIVDRPRRSTDRDLGEEITGEEKHGC